jgi:sec-independent protein translocase protein TatA
MGSLGAPEIIIIAVVLVLLFGATKLPVFAKSLGESLRIFKREIKSEDKQERRGPELPPILADNGRADSQPSAPRETTETR